jgi:hypothetical protein
MSKFTIYVLQLENDKWFLHLSSSPKEYIELECQTLFEFVQKNKPIRIFETIKCFDKFDINTNVKRYMEWLGIDNVRGGIYSEELLDESSIQSLKLELSSSLEKYEKKASIFFSLYNKGNITSEDFNEKMNEYRILVDSGYNSLNRGFFTDLEWLTNRISDEKAAYVVRKPGICTVSSADNQRYMKLLKTMEIVYKLYFNLNEDNIKVVSTPLIKRPLYLLDNFFYNHYGVNEWNNRIDEALELIRRYEFMGYTLINIIDGLEFDLYN